MNSEKWATTFLSLYFNGYSSDPVRPIMVCPPLHLQTPQQVTQNTITAGVCLWRLLLLSHCLSMRPMLKSSLPTLRLCLSFCLSLALSLPNLSLFWHRSPLSFYPKIFFFQTISEMNWWTLPAPDWCFSLTHTHMWTYTHTREFTTWYLHHFLFRCLASFVVCYHFPVQLNIN